MGTPGTGLVGRSRPMEKIGRCSLPKVNVKCWDWLRNKNHDNRGYMMQAAVLERITQNKDLGGGKHQR